MVPETEKKTLLVETLCEKEGEGWFMCSNEHYLAVGVDTSLLIYHIDTLELLRTISTDHPSETRIRRGEFRPGFPTVIGIGYFNGLCDIIDVDKEKLIQRLEGAESEIKSVSFSPSGERLSFSTRDGSVWIWKETEGEWEIEEIIEYSENDVKTAIWSEDTLVTMGYSNETVIYQRWEDEMCEVKWEIDAILKTTCTHWDGAFIHDGPSTYLGTVTQDGSLAIYHKESTWKEQLTQSISFYPVIAICQVSLPHSQDVFGMITNRNTLSLYSTSGSLFFKQIVASPEEEPIDLLFSKKASSLFILFFSYVQRKRSVRVKVVRGLGQWV
ncbi:hypothetical protein NEDG_00712 [Nematocida displodere]|uniref:Uncharacterized protein n=1 Tax=Nematocida displodere TaxID=1805483 RepID=A0A177EF11_9MICR|nr:hypothetical protein NEDG_00712 [Nematocida displodere]